MSSRLSQVLRQPRRLRFTTEGRWFVFLTIAVGAGAINTANNLLYLLLGMMLGLIVLSGVLSELMLRGLVVERIASGTLFARQPAVLTWSLRNTKRVLPSFSIEVVEHESRPTRARRRVHLGLSPQPRRKRFGGGVVEDGDPGPPKGLALRVPARGQAVATGEAVFPLRGIYRWVGVDIATRFPFNFFEKTRPVDGEHEVLVLPPVDRARAAQVRVESMEGEVMRRTEGRGGEFFGLREFREGEDRRDIHWKASARRNAPVRRVYEREENEAVAIALYNHVPPGLSPSEAEKALAAFEEAVELTASLCARFVDEGWRVSLHTIEGHVVEGTGAGQLLAQLRHLALLEVRRDESPPGLDLPARAGTLLVATPGTPASVRAVASLVVSTDGEVLAESAEAAPSESGLSGTSTEAA